MSTASPEAHSARELGQGEPRPSGLLLDSPSPHAPAWQSPRERLEGRAELVAGVEAQSWRPRPQKAQSWCLGG